MTDPFGYTLTAGISCFFWCLVYIHCIYVGYKQKTYCVPLPALMFNHAWEIYYTLHGQDTPTMLINLFEAILDTCIVITALLYGHKKYYNNIPYWLYLTVLIQFWVFCWLITHFLRINIGDKIGLYSGWGDGAFIEMLWVYMLYYRWSNPNVNTMDGQSM